MRGTLLGLLIGATLLLVCACSGAARPEMQSSRCYEATGHTVSGAFLEFFDGLGGPASLGYPITEPLEQEGRLVQYFTYARLEDHPDNPGGRVVKLSMLGERMGRRRPPIDARRAPATLDRTARFYPESGHSVFGDFSRFVEDNGDMARFGLAISEPLVSDGRLVQDFQRVRLVWDANAAQRVTVEESGRVYFDLQNLDKALLAPLACPAGAATVANG